jgi:hypothetical protein
MSSSTRGSSSDTSLFLLAGAVVAGAALWAAGALAAIVAGHRVPRGHPLAGVDALAHLGDPSRAWGAPVGSVGLYWSVVAAVVLVIAGLAAAIWRAVRWANQSGEQNPARIEGLANRRQVQAAAGAKLLVRRAQTLRPSLERPEVSQVGYFLGTSQKMQCWASVEDSIFVLGPPRAGKGLHAVIPSILDSEPVTYSV